MRSTTKIMLTLGAALWLGIGCGASPAPADTTPSTESSEPTGPSIVVTPEMGHPHPGDEAPDFELPDQEGDPLRLSSLRGSVVVLSFAASWCPFSTAQQPHLAQLARDYADRGVRVVVVDIEAADDGYRTYLERVEMPMPVLRDPEAQVVGTYIPPRAQPNIERDRWKVIVSSNLVIDAEGTIRFFTLADTLAFDTELVHVRAAVDELIGAGAGS